MGGEEERLVGPEAGSLVFWEWHQWPQLHRAEGLLREVGEAVAELVPVLSFKADPFPAKYY